MALNRTIRGRRGETNFCFRTPLIDDDGNTLDLDDINFTNCDARLWVTPVSGGEAIISDAQMDAHPNQTRYPNQIAYFATEAEMQSPAGDYDWEIVFTDTSNIVTTFPKDTDDCYGLFRMLPTLQTFP